MLSSFPFIQEAADAAKSAMVSVIGLDAEKVQQLCDAANEEVPDAEKVQIANFLCTVSFIWICLLYLRSLFRIMVLNFMIST